jgi:hypothetical protein
MKRAVLLTTVLAFALVAMVTITIAQQSQVIHFQGILVDSGGSPLRTDFYNVNFSIWEHATNAIDPLWAETQTVEVTDGLFDVFLGSSNPLAPDVFNDDDDDGTYLGIQVEGDEPMTPRIQMGKTPNSFISARLLGDVETGEGSILLRNPESDSAISITSDGIANSFMINWAEPLDMPSPAIEMTAGSGEAGMIMQGIDGESTDSTAIVLNTASRNAGLILKSFPTINQFSSEVEIGTNSEGADMRMNICETNTPVIAFHADTSEGIFQMTRYSPTQIEEPSLELGVNPSGGSIRMFQPQPEPPGEPILQMITDETGGSIKLGGLIDIFPLLEFLSSSSEVIMSLADPRPTPAFPDLTIVGDDSGTKITTKGLIDTFPFFELFSDFSESKLTLEYQYPAQPVPGFSVVADDQGSEVTLGILESQDRIISIAANSSGGSMMFYNPGSRDIMIELSTSGDVIGQRGNFGVGNLLGGLNAFVAGSGNTASGDYSTVGGGQNNQATEDYSTVAGGQNNTANGLGSFIGGGYQNTASGGHCVVGGGNFNVNQGNYSTICGGFADTLTSTAQFSFLFGVGSKLTADSTFMVDMSHIHFGDETSGYEFPTFDGEDGNVLVTDGDGHLSWSSVATGAGVEKLLDIIEQQNMKIEDLNNKIAELEGRIK